MENRKKLWSTLLTLAMLLSLAPTLGGSAKATGPHHLCVGHSSGQHGYFDLMEEDNYPSDLFTYNKTTNTLTLKDYEMDMGAGYLWFSDKRTCGIYCDGPLNIVVQGNCSICPDDENQVYGIYVDGDLTITNAARQTAVLTLGGKGNAKSLSAGIWCTHNLTVQNNSDGGSITVNALGSATGNGEVNRSWGVYMDGGNLEVKSGTLNATGGTTGATTVTDGERYSYGIRTDGSVTVSGGTLVVKGGTAGNSSGIYAKRNVTVSSGSLTASSNSHEGWGYGIECEGNLTVSGGRIRATGGSETNGRGWGVRCLSTIALSGTGTLNAIGGMDAGNSLGAACKTLTCAGSAEMTATGRQAGNSSTGISVGTGGMTVSGGKVTASGGLTLGQQYSYGIEFYESSMTVTGGCVVAKGNNNAMWAPKKVSAPIIAAGTGGTDVALTEAYNYRDWRYAEFYASLDVISGVPDGNLLSYTVEKAPAGAMLIAARYDGGRMTDVQTASITAAGNASGSFTMKGSGSKFKLMLVGKTTCAPLCPAWSN